MQVKFSSVNLGYLKNSIGPEIDEAVWLTVEAIKDEAKLRCPVKSGTLRDSIDSEMDESTPVGEAIGYVYTDGSAHYDQYVHDGTVRNGPNPFLRIAADNNEEIFYDYVGRAINNHLAGK